MVIQKWQSFETELKQSQHSDVHLHPAQVDEAEFLITPFISSTLSVTKSQRLFTFTLC